MKGVYIRYFCVVSLRIYTEVPPRHQRVPHSFFIFYFSYTTNHMYVFVTAPVLVCPLLYTSSAAFWMENRVSIVNDNTIKKKKIARTPAYGTGGKISGVNVSQLGEHPFAYSNFWVNARRYVFVTLNTFVYIAGPREKWTSNEHIFDSAISSMTTTTATASPQKKWKLDWWSDQFVRQPWF